MTNNDPFSDAMDAMSASVPTNMPPIDIDSAEQTAWVIDYLKQGIGDYRFPNYLTERLKRQQARDKDGELYPLIDGAAKQLFAGQDGTRRFGSEWNHLMEVDKDQYRASIRHLLKTGLITEEQLREHGMVEEPEDERTDIATGLRYDVDGPVPGEVGQGFERVAQKFNNAINPEGLGFTKDARR